MAGKINVMQCPSCGDESQSTYTHFCRECNCRYVQISRDKIQVIGDFTVVDWFSSRSSAGLIVEDGRSGVRYPLYMSDVFEFLNGLQLVGRTLEETKKGSAYGWKVITKEGE